MATELNTSFDICRANLDLALRMVPFGPGCRRYACVLQTQRINLDLIRAALQRWQPVWTTQCQKAADVSGAGTPIQDWVQRFEQAISGAVPVAMPEGNMGAEAAPVDAEGGPSKKGERHVG